MGIAVKGAEAEHGAGGTICFACNVTHPAKEQRATQTEFLEWG